MRIGFAAAALAATIVLAPTLALAEGMTLRFGSPIPKVAAFSDGVFGAWAKKVTEASGGELTVDFVPGGLLGAHGQMYENVINGVADIGFDVPQYYGGRFPKSDVVSLPFNFDSAVGASVALARMSANGVIDEFGDVVVLSMFAFPNSYIMSNAPIAGLDEMSGKKIISTGKLRSDALKYAGATPLTISIDEVYQALSRRVSDGIVFPYTTLQPFKLTEVVNHYYDVPLGGTAGMVFINKAKFEALSDKARAALLEASGEVLAREFGTFLTQMENDGRKMATDAGGTIVTPTAEDIALWKERIAPVYAEFESNTPNGSAILEEFRSEVAAASD